MVALGRMRITNQLLALLTFRYKRVRLLLWDLPHIPHLLTQHRDCMRYIDDALSTWIFALPRDNCGYSCPFGDASASKCTQGLTSSYVFAQERQPLFDCTIKRGAKKLRYTMRTVHQVCDISYFSCSSLLKIKALTIALRPGSGYAPSIDHGEAGHIWWDFS